MKKVLISIFSIDYERILKGKNVIWLRDAPIEVPFKCYIYIEKNKYFDKVAQIANLQTNKVVGEFICDEIDKNRVDYTTIYTWHIANLKIYDKPKKLNEFYRECEKPKCEGCPYFYVVNTLNPYKKYCEGNEKIPITLTSQRWCYVEEE